MFYTPIWLHRLMKLSFLQTILSVGTKLQAIITQMALEITERHAVIQGIPLVQLSDHHFWFGRPRFILFLIHFALFQVYLNFISICYDQIYKEKNNSLLIVHKIHNRWVFLIDSFILFLAECFPADIFSMDMGQFFSFSVIVLRDDCACFLWSDNWVLVAVRVWIEFLFPWQ